MGVSGCGKTTVGEILSQRLGWNFVESDDFHSAKDIQKMSAGIPLSDADRWPWLMRLNKHLIENQNTDIRSVLACSALKQSYREMLHSNIQTGVFVYLKGSYHQILERMKEREHFMKPSMLQSQFDTLEEPSNALEISIRFSPEAIVEKIITRLDLMQNK